MGVSTLSAEEREVNEETSAKYTLTLGDESGAAILKTDITALTLTLFDKTTEAIINSRDNLSVLDANGGSLSADAVLTMTFEPDDMVVLNDDAPPMSFETHLALFRWTYGGGKQGSHVLPIRVRVLSKVPAV